MVLDYVWVNENYEIVTETLTCDIYYDKIEDVPPYYDEHYMIKPQQLFKNPFKTSKDLIILCDLYCVNYFIEPPEIMISDNHQRILFNNFMKDYYSPSFKITQKYKLHKNIFLEHKKICNYIGIDIFGRHGEYSIFTEKDNVYNYIWMSRYILYKLTDLPIEWSELLLVTNTEDDITNELDKINLKQLNPLEMEMDKDEFI